MPIPVAQCPPDAETRAVPGVRVGRALDVPASDIYCDWCGWLCKVCGARWWLDDGYPWEWLVKHEGHS